MYCSESQSDRLAIQLLSLVLRAALVSCEFCLKAVYYVFPNFDVNRPINCKRSLPETVRLAYACTCLCGCWYRRASFSS